MENEKIFAKKWRDYELIDAGGGKKLERWGEVFTIRPELQAYFKSGLPFTEWHNLAHWEYVEKQGKNGRWKNLMEAPSEWTINFGTNVFNLTLTNYKHVGLFPEQNYNWEILKSILKPQMRVLNLFAYTGAASIVARSTGAEVTHVDAVKQLISWARMNMEDSGLDGIKWVHDDALKFANREVNRKNTYDVVIMDPPAWGIGANKEKWKIETHLPELVNMAYQLLSPNGHLFLNTYSPKVETLDLHKIGSQYFREDKLAVHELWMNTYSNKELFFGHVLHGEK